MSSSLFDELVPDTTSAGQERTEGSRAPSLFDELSVGELTPAPSSDSSAIGGPVNRIELPELTPEILHKGAGSFQGFNPFQWMTDKKHDAGWAIDTALSGMRVTQDTFFAFLKGEHEADPQKFQARVERGKTVFDRIKSPKLALALDQIERIKDPVEAAEKLRILQESYGVNDATDLMTRPKLREMMAEMGHCLG